MRHLVLDVHHLFHLTLPDPYSVIVATLDDVLICERLAREIQVRDFMVRKDRCRYVYRRGDVFCAA